MGKAYANRRPVENRPAGDFYPTPRSLMREAAFLFREFLDRDVETLDPCCGGHVMAEELRAMGFKDVTENDLYGGGVDYLTADWPQRQVVMNPPFSEWDAFVMKAKSHCDAFVALGRLNYLSTQSRLESGVWDGLALVCPFSRYVDYRTPQRDDGLFHVGAMATGWFVWEKGFAGRPEIHIIDVDRYARLGNYRDPDWSFTPVPNAAGEAR